MKIPYEYVPKCRGRRPGSKNKPGHKAGRPSGDKQPSGKQCGAVAPKQVDPLQTGKDPDRPLSRKVAYDAPMPCTDGHNCPGNGNGKPRICKDPLPNLPAKPLQIACTRPNMLESICQSGENPGLITPEELVREIQCLATSDIRLIPGCPDDIPDEIAPAISSFQITKTKVRNKDGSEVETESVKYTLWSKSTAQDQLAKWHGLYAKDKVPAGNQYNQFNQVNIGARPDLSRLSDEELELWYALLSKTEVCDVLDVSPVGP